MGLTSNPGGVGVEEYDLFAGAVVLIVDLGCAGITLEAFGSTRGVAFFLGLSSIERILASARDVILDNLEFSEGFGSKFGLNSRFSFGS
jgi:hypothetical protein